MQHIAITFEGGAALRFYLNGVEDGSDLAGVTAVMETSASLSWTVGANHHQTTNANNMVIGDLWVGEVVATLAQIQAVYNSGVPIHPGEGGIGGPYGKLGVTPLVFLGGPGYDWTATPLANPGSLGTAVVTGTITAG